ncbi:MAG: energy transducer TonB [Flavobacteriales bacterium]|nr:energy transducer TonB [Flavobacteriales bacterium]MCB9447443.1 energy transducer TonB [Flavobacteriales bacterium]
MAKSLLSVLLLILPVMMVYAQTEDSSAEVKVKIDKMPKFEGGQSGLSEYLANTIQLPEAGAPGSGGGTVVTKFVIDEKGKVGQVTIVQGVNEFYDKEAKRVISQMPRWTPAMKDGKPVLMEFTLPISFPPS